jgi:hypothetical protein
MAFQLWLSSEVVGDIEQADLNEHTAGTSVAQQLWLTLSQNRCG